MRKATSIGGLFLFNESFRFALDLAEPNVDAIPLGTLTPAEAPLIDLEILFRQPDHLYMGMRCYEY